MSPLLKRRDLRRHLGRGAAGHIVPRDVDAGDQAFFGERRHLGKGRVADDEMSPETDRLRGLGLQHVALADLEGQMRAEHRQRRQAPQQHQQPSGDPTAPDAATDQNDDDGDAHRHQCDVSSSTQRDHIGIVVVDAREQERQRGQPEQDDAATFDDRHRDSCAFAERTLRDHRRYQTCSADASAEAASAPNLHKNPESLQTPFPASARPTMHSPLRAESRRPSRAAPCAQRPVFETIPKE